MCPCKMHHHHHTVHQISSNVLSGYIAHRSQRPLCLAVCVIVKNDEFTLCAMCVSVAMAATAETSFHYINSLVLCVARGSAEARHHRQLQPVVSSSFLGFDSLFLHLILYPSLVLFLIICEFALKCDIRRIQERFRFPVSTASVVVLLYSMPTLNIDAPNKMHRMQIFGNFSRKERDRHTK